MKEQLLIVIIPSIVTAAIGWFVGKRKQQAETDNQVLQNLEISVNLYKKIIDDLKNEIHQLNNKIDELELKVEQLLDENRKLKNKL
jgi:peptidoglycan hydrolase CwlO-like protein